MKKLSLLLVASFFILSSLSAQDLKPVLKSGARSLNFTFAGLGTFGLGGAGVSGGLGMTFFTGSDAAFRVGFQAGYSKQTTPWDASTPGEDGSASELGVGIGVDYLMYMNAMTPRVKPFWGVGGSVTLRSSDQKFPVSSGAGAGTQTGIKNNDANAGTAFGVQGIIGAEFFLYSELSLSAEYDVNLISISAIADKVVSYKGNPDVTTKRGSAMSLLGVGAGSATLHIYF